MYLKDFRKGIYQKSYVAMEPMMKEIAFRLNLTYDEARFVNLEEIYDGLLKGRNFKNAARKRIKYCVARIENGKTRVFAGKRAESIIRKRIIVHIQDKKDVKKIKGMPAFAGMAKGKVKIVAVAQDVFKMEDGDILVSPATNPDLILAMKKAAAIVTDMGGIVSHAVIVSGELEIPCVVGTKIGTKVLKDRDRVEIDANKGIVKILK
jgi:phosphohistidine swiveling domain-containing protein